MTINTVAKVISYKGDVYTRHEAHDIVPISDTGSGPEGELLIERQYDVGTVGLYYDTTDGSFFAVVQLKDAIVKGLGALIHELPVEKAKQFFIDLINREGSGLGGVKVDKDRARELGIMEDDIDATKFKKVIDVSGKALRIARRTPKGEIGKPKRQMTVSPDKKPGEISTDLRRHMSDPLADLFSKVGVQLYTTAVTSVKDSITKLFKKSVEELGNSVKDELGKRGYEESLEHIRPWMKEIIQDVSTYGLNDVVKGLDSAISGLSAEYVEEPKQEGVAEPDLLETDIPEIPVEEVKEVETIPEVPTVEETKTDEEQAVPTTPTTAPTPVTPPTTPASIPAAKASVSVSRDFVVNPRLKAVFASSKQKQQLLDDAKRKIMETTKTRFTSVKD